MRRAHWSPNTAELALFLLGIMLIYASRRLEKRSGIQNLNGIVHTARAVLGVHDLVTTGTAGALAGLAGIDLLFAAVFNYYVLTLPTLARP